MGGKTFPKENEKKLKLQIREMQAHIRSLEKQVTFLMNEIENIQKPVRNRKKNEPPPAHDPDAFRKSFLKKFKREVLGQDEE
jgi:uncharacterized coiled-coil protein SlyX